MQISDMVSLVQTKQWTKINNFSVDLDFVNAGAAVGPEQFAKMCGWKEITPDDINSALISVNTPQYQNALVNQYVSYEWRFHQGRDELYRFSMTFRDYNQMKLYTTFKTLYIKAKDQYYDKIKMNVKIIMDEDFGGEEKPVFQTSTAIIESVSQLQFAHTTENQIAEFTVNFISNTNEVNGSTTINNGNTIGVN